MKKEIIKHKNQAFPCDSSYFKCIYYSQKLKKCTYDENIEYCPCMMKPEQFERPVAWGYETGDRP